MARQHILCRAFLLLSAFMRTLLFACSTLGVRFFIVPACGGISCAGCSTSASAQFRTVSGVLGSALVVEWTSSRCFARSEKCCCHYRTWPLRSPDRFRSLRQMHSGSSHLICSSRTGPQRRRCLAGIVRTAASRDKDWPRSRPCGPMR